jgi:hypothetical protein
MQKSLLLLSFLGIFWACQPAEKTEPGTEKIISPEEIPMIHASGATLI